MDTLSAFMMGARSAGSRTRVFDWDKAARLISERRPDHASAGLGDDWEYTGGCIWRDGAPVLEDYTYLASTWATPELDMDGDVTDCWRWMDEPGCSWGCDTKWPESALALVAASAPRVSP